MKKRVFILTPILLLTTCFTSCFKYNEADFLCDCGKIEIGKKEYITMCVLPQEVTINSHSCLRIENHTKSNISYGQDFHMEYLNKNNWEPIDFDFYFNKMSYSTQAGTTTVERANIYSLTEQYNNACEGKYRITKNVGNHHTLVAEFNLIRNEPLEVSLTNTKWKLVRFVDVLFGEIKIAKPKAPMYNFLIFNEDATVSGFSSANELIGNYEFDLSTCYINIDVHAMTEVGENEDGELFLESLGKVDFFALQEHELRLYYNNKQNYLLFKPRTL
jgi:hypothetical protein